MTSHGLSSIGWKSEDDFHYPFPSGKTQICNGSLYFLPRWLRRPSLGIRSPQWFLWISDSQVSNKLTPCLFFNNKTNQTRKNKLQLELAGIKQTNPANVFVPFHMFLLSWKNNIQILFPLCIQLCWDDIKSCPFFPSIHVHLTSTKKHCFFWFHPPTPNPPQKNSSNEKSSEDIAGGVAPRQRWSEFHRCDKRKGMGFSVVENVPRLQVPTNYLYTPWRWWICPWLICYVSFREGTVHQKMMVWKMYTPWRWTAGTFCHGGGWRSNVLAFDGWCVGSMSIFQGNPLQHLSHTIHVW